MPKKLLVKWEDKIAQRISNRVIAGVQRGYKTNEHHEAKLPYQPKYLIEINPDNVIDLSKAQRSK